MSAELEQAYDASAEVQFDSRLLDSLGVDIDLARFSRADVIPPGHYQLDITLNGKERLSQQVEVRAGEDPGTPRFCFQSGQLKQWGLLLDKLPDQAEVKRQLSLDCIEVGELVPGASFMFDLASLSGALSLPQAYLGQVRRDYVGPEQWVQGINAAFVSYNANLYYSEQEEGSDPLSGSVNLNTGLNLGAWRLRHNGSYQGGSHSGYQALNSYAQRDITSQTAQLTLGEYFTPGDSFDSVPFTGVQIASDDAMLPDFERGFAPVVRGVAQSNARVTIRQGSALIYETQVAPGAFAIDDLYATSFAGDLDVTITEADGSEQRFTLPFSSVVQMLRDDTSRFSLTLGRYRNEVGPDGPDFAQGTYRRGLSDALTLYGGAIAAEDYTALLGGAAVGSDYGALALDVTGSWARALPASTDLPTSLSGQSYRLTYSKQMDMTRTYFTLAAYRFSSEGYLDLDDVAAMQAQALDRLQRERNRFQLNVNQPVGEWGDLYFNGIRRDYWGGQGESSSFQLGYNRGFDWGSLTLSASHSLEEGVGDQYVLSLSIPIGDKLGAPRLGSTLSYQEGQGASARLDLNGGTQDGRFYYGFYGSHGTREGSPRGYGANLQYQTASTQLGLSTSQGEGYAQYVASAKGTLLVHGEGWVLGQTQGETMALVEAKGAQGARVSHGIGSEVDGDGYAVLAGLNPYRTNIIGLDPSGLPLDVEIDGSARMVAPRRGAIVKLAYETHVGQPLLIKAERQDGSAPPFGAEVVDGNGGSVAVVGQGGLIFVRGEQGTLYVQWGGGAGGAVPAGVPCSPAGSRAALSAGGSLLYRCGGGLMRGGGYHGMVLAALLWATDGEGALNLMRTRIVHEGGEASLLVRNDGTAPSLLQAWVDAGNEHQGPAEVATPFLVVPPVMRLGHGRGQTLRILGADLDRLPRDRESLFWLNVLGLPPQQQASQGSVQLAYRTRIKLFYRPPGLAGSVAEAVSRLGWQVRPGGLRVTNPGPFHISLSEVLLTVGKGRLAWQEGGVLPPYGALSVPMAGTVLPGATGRLRWIDDNGIYHEQAFVPGQGEGVRHE